MAENTLKPELLAVIRRKSDGKEIVVAGKPESPRGSNQGDLASPETANRSEMAESDTAYRGALRTNSGSASNASEPT